jgi:hypothetical protein
MTKKDKPEIKLGATVRLQAHSGEIVEGRVVHLWEDKSVLMVRVSIQPSYGRTVKKVKHNFSRSQKALTIGLRRTVRQKIEVARTLLSSLSVMTLPGDLRFSSLGSVALRSAILVLAIWPISSVGGLLIGE